MKRKAFHVEKTLKRDLPAIPGKISQKFGCDSRPERRMDETAFARHLMHGSPIPFFRTILWDKISLDDIGIRRFRNDVSHAEGEMCLTDFLQKTRKSFADALPGLCCRDGRLTRLCHRPSLFGLSRHIFCAVSVSFGVYKGSCQQQRKGKKKELAHMFPA